MIPKNNGGENDGGRSPRQANDLQVANLAKLSGGSQITMILILLQFYYKDKCAVFSIIVSLAIAALFQ